MNEKPTKNNPQKDAKLFMKKWETKYVRAIIDTLSPSGEVLSVGFNNGKAAQYIQEFSPKSHIIIESDPKLIKKAKKWALAFPQVTILEDTWQNALSRLGSFDSIYLNASIEVLSPDKEIELVKKLGLAEVSGVGTHAQATLAEIEEQLSQLTITYSDSDIDNFYEKIGKFNQGDLPNFFSALRDRGFITQEQYDNATKKYNVKKQEKKTIEQKEVPQPSDGITDFIEECLQNHMRKGSLCSCYLQEPISKYEDPRFFAAVITRLDVDYKEKFAKIDLPNCTLRDPIVMLVEKL